MTFPLFLSQYVWWHYHDGFHACRRHVLNFPRLVWRLFAPVSLVRSLFLPLQRLQEPYRKQDSLEDWAGSFVVNAVMRGLGALIRSVFLVLGLASFLVSSLLSTLALFVWVVLPLICVASLFAVVTILA